MVQVALSILKPAGSVGVTVQLAIAPPVNAPAPNLTNATGADQIATTDSAITDITFSNSGGAIVSCTVAPVGTPLMVQVALSILKPAGSVGVTVQLAIAPPELLKVMLVMAKLIIAISYTQSLQKMPQMMIVLTFL
jgi:hypothetical protein